MEIIICPYCGAKTIHVPNCLIYGKSYGNGNSYVCGNWPFCDSYVGSHSNGKPLGTPASPQLRELRNQVHKIFDKRWNQIEDVEKKKYQRFHEYAELARYLNIEPFRCHIGMFNVKRCKKTIDYCYDK